MNCSRILYTNCHSGACVMQEHRVYILTYQMHSKQQPHLISTPPQTPPSISPLHFPFSNRQCNCEAMDESCCLILLSKCRSKLFHVGWPSITFVCCKCTVCSFSCFILCLITVIVTKCALQCHHVLDLLNIRWCWYWLSENKWRSSIIRMGYSSFTFTHSIR